jgi:hypothetical protein
MTACEQNVAWVLDKELDDMRKENGSLAGCPGLLHKRGRLAQQPRRRRSGENRQGKQAVPQANKGGGFII